MASTCRKYPIVVIEVPTPEQLGYLWQEGGLQALAEAIAADLRKPEIGGIIEIPIKEEVLIYDEIFELLMIATALFYTLYFLSSKLVQLQNSSQRLQ